MITSYLLIASLAGTPASGATFSVEVAAGAHRRVQTPVRVPVTLPAAQADARRVLLRTENGLELEGQLTRPGLLSDADEAPAGQVRRELHFILPDLRPGRTAAFTATVVTDPAPPGESFRWHDTPEQHAELRFGSRPVLRYMYAPLDDSSPERREQTYKVFHHLYDPAATRLVTKGPGGQFTHHRGLFYGFNRVSYDDKQADIWHCTGDTYQEHVRFLEIVEGPVLARHRVRLNWRGPGKQVFATEEREVTVYHVPGGQLVQFASRLRSAGPKVRLDGDPQHAGFHFRADNEVAAETKGQTYYLRPDGRGKPGETRNWPGDRDHVNLPWDAMSFVLGGRRYTALYLDRPQNPKEARFSERDYGRFGSYFEYDLAPERPLTVAYRLWLQEGELTPEAAARRSADFVSPPEARVPQTPGAGSRTGALSPTEPRPAAGARRQDPPGQRPPAPAAAVR